jgi:hypothetical protein
MTRARGRAIEGRAGGVRMIVVLPSIPDGDVIGLKAVPGRLPQVLRFPGESQTSLRFRSLAMVRGSGPLLVFPLLRD